MILSVLFNGFLHETREGGEDVNRRVDLLVVELSVDEDLTFGDVAGQIGNGMGDIVVLNRALGTGMDRMGI